MSRAVAERLARLVGAAGLDALVCLSPENVAYAAGFVVPSQPIMRWRHAGYVLTPDGADAMLCVDMEESTVRAARPELTLAVWAEFTGDAMTSLAALLTSLGLERSVLGFELRYLSAQDRDHLVELLPGLRIAAADDLLTTARAIKTEPEKLLLERLSRISDRSIAAALTSVRAGDTELDIAAAMTRSLYEQGAQQFKLMIVATGERSQLPNVGPTERVLRPLDVCRVEIFAVIDGYHAGVCRTAVVGEPPPAAERVYRNLVKCQVAVLHAMRPGTPTAAVYDVFRRTFDELGMPPIAFVGHSIGVNLHEAPYLGPHDPGVLETGMVLGMEPLVYRSGFGFGMQIKDMVLIEDDGARLLSDVTDTSQLLVVEA